MADWQTLRNTHSIGFLKPRKFNDPSLVRIYRYISYRLGPLGPHRKTYENEEILSQRPSFQKFVPKPTIHRIIIYGNWKICDNYLEWNANKVNSGYNMDNMCPLNLATLGSGYRAGYWQQLVTGYDYSNVDNIKGALNMILTRTSMAESMVALTTLIGEEALLFREHHNRTYALFPYILATIITQKT
ncbi:unnamed protein product [Oppiella nova]|uniref:Uncharacterized protein n=1 Tax=Oppiella nova TaxID=334625 RepID=A0A7R9QLN9_9ACAR|nr:unnamed protein product [Oppiella nova]CAG2168439.1 unnamed protein product [Oppiella nova]